MSKNHDRRHLLAFRGIVIASGSYRCRLGERVKYITVLETLPEFAIIRSSVSEDEYQRQKNRPKKNHAVVHPGQSSTTIWRLIDRRIQSTNWTMYASINNGLLTNFIFSEAFLTEGTIINLKSVEPHSLVLPPEWIQVQPRLLWRGPCIRAWNHSSSLGRQLPHRPGQGPEELRYPTSNFYLCTWVVGLFIAIVGSQG